MSKRKNRPKSTFWCEGDLCYIAYKFPIFLFYTKSQFTFSMPIISGIAWPNYITLNRYNSFKRIKAAPIRHWTGKTVVLTINKTVTRFPTASVKPTANFTGVMILTYMRSGSSLTGDILQHSPDAFYVYEPMHEFNVDNLPYTPPVNLTFVNGTRR